MRAAMSSLKCLFSSNQFQTYCHIKEGPQFLFSPLPLDSLLTQELSGLFYFLVCRPQGNLL